MTRLDFSWKDKEKKYWHYDERGIAVVNNDAPRAVKEAYYRFIKQAGEAKSRGTL